MHFVSASSGDAGDWTPVSGTVCVNDTSSVRQCKLKRLETRVETAWLQRLKLKYDELLSSFAFNSNLRHYRSNVSIAEGKLTCSVDVNHFSLYTLAEVSPTLRATSCADGSETCADGSDAPCADFSETCADVAVTFMELGTAANVTAANAIKVWPAATIEDTGDFMPKSTEVNSISVTISTGFMATEDALGYAWTGTTTTNADGCVIQTGQIHQACWDSTAAVLTLKNAVDGLTLLRAAAQAVLQGVTYINKDHETPVTQPRRFQVTVDEPFSESTYDMNRYIQVVTVNDLPTITLTPGTKNYKEKAPQIYVDDGLTISDVDTDITGATVTLEGFYNDLDHVGSATGVTGINYIADTSVDGQYTLKFSGAASPENYQTALRGIYYWNNGPVNQDPNRTFTYVVTDAEAGTSTSVRNLVILPTNDAPTIPTTAKAISVNEDFNVTSTFDGAIDADSSNLTFRVTCAPSLGTVYMGVANLDGTTNNSFTYVPTPDAFGSDTFVYVASDGFLESNLGTVTVDIVPKPDKPRTDNLEIVVQVCTAAQKTAGKSGCDMNFTIPGRDVDDPGINNNLYRYYIMTEPQAGTLILANSGTDAESDGLGATRYGQNPAYFEVTSDQLGDLAVTELSFTYRVQNEASGGGGGEMSPTTGTVTITLSIPNAGMDEHILTATSSTL